jgi:hypothetical protein
MLKTLAQAAVVGVRTAPLPQLPTADQGINALCAAARADRAEQTLLRWAAIAAVIEDAGHKPIKPDMVDIPICPADARPAIHPRAAHLLSRAIESFSPALVDVLLAEITARGKRVSTALLPRVLDHGKHHAHRDAVMAVASNGARWLASQNPEWSYALGADDLESIFETGPTPARREALHRLRAKDPAQARELVTAVWATEPPENRSMFLEALATNLSDADEAFLDAALDDRRKEVRAAAARLLATMPASRLVARARAIAATILRVEKGWLKTKLEVNPSAECTKAMQRDGIEVKSSDRALGERAWWLAQVIARVPPSDWTKRFNVAPGELLGLTRQHEYGLALRMGLARATQNFRDVEFARAWLALAGESDFAPQCQNVLPVLKDLPDLEGIVLDALRDPANGIAHDLLELLPAPWSEAVSGAFLSLLRKRRAVQLYSSNSAGYSSLASELVFAALRMKPLAEALNGWEVRSDAGSSVKRAIDEFITIMDLRLQFSRYLED